MKITASLISASSCHLHFVLLTHFSLSLDHVVFSFSLAIYFLSLNVQSLRRTRLLRPAKDGLVWSSNFAYPMRMKAN